MDQQHLAVLKEGTNTLLSWRPEHPDVRLDLTDAILKGVHLSRAPLAQANFSQADLMGAHLAEAHLTGANLTKADLSGADLTNVDLVKADLTGANLTGAHLGGADLSGACLKGANLRQAYLTKAQLGQAILSGADLSAVHLNGAYLAKAQLDDADLSEADLSEAYLAFADLTKAKLVGADLHSTHFLNATLVEANLHNIQSQMVSFRRANLMGANLSEALLITADFVVARLTRANLTGANLSFSDFSRAKLDGTNFSNSYMQGNIFGDVDISVAQGLETITHYGISIIGIETIYRSQGNIPEVFLRGTGVPDSFIAYIRAIVGQPIDYYTCFISYSSKDQAFAERLYADLQNKGVRCWFAPEDLKIGDKIRPRIDESIRLYDKLLIVLSEHSVTSQWVEQEVETALAKERKEQRAVLFPIRLDKAIMQIERGWPALIRNTRNIGDFTRWKHHDAYQKALDRLLRDLKAEAVSDGN